MRIRLLGDVPVAEEHGMTKGRALEVLRKRPPNFEEREVDKPRWWVMGDAGEEVGILPHEAEEIRD